MGCSKCALCSRCWKGLCSTAFSEHHWKNGESAIVFWNTNEVQRYLDKCFQEMALQQGYLLLGTLYTPRTRKKQGADMNTEKISNLMQLYGSGPRQRLEIVRAKLRRIHTHTTANPTDVQNDSETLRLEIQQLESELTTSTATQKKEATDEPERPKALYIREGLIYANRDEKGAEAIVSAA